MSENKIKLTILGISFSQVQPGAYALIFAEEQGIRRLPVVIGTPEAQSIAIVMENIPTPRPLTHDLIKSMMSEFSINLKEVLIYKFENGAFHSELLFSQGDKEVRIDARTSDAVAIALRTNTPIFTTSEIMEEMAVVIDENVTNLSDAVAKEENEEEDDLEDITILTVEELSNLLEKAIQDEDYELATTLRDEINNRKK